MKLMIISDIHGSYNDLEKVMHYFDEEQPDRLIILGDILYHGPRNDLPEGYAPKKCIPLLNKYKDKILAVRGNCDAEVDQMVLDFPMRSNYALLNVDGHDFLHFPAPSLRGHKYITKLKSTKTIVCLSI